MSTSQGKKIHRLVNGGGVVYLPPSSLLCPTRGGTQSESGGWCDSPPTPCRPLWGTVLTQLFWLNKTFRSRGMVVEVCYPTGVSYHFHSVSCGEIPMTLTLVPPHTPVIRPTLSNAPCTMVPPQPADARVRPPSACLPFGMVGIPYPLFW